MTTVPVHVIDMGAAAVIGGARFTRKGRTAVIIHSALPLEEQATLIMSLLYPGEQPACALTVYPSSSQPQNMVHMGTVR